MSLVQRGARNRRTPYYEATQKYGPKGFTVYNHMYFPIRFDSFEAEFDALLNGVTLWDVSVERCLEISGPDGYRFAQLLTPRDLSTCAVGQAKYVLICDADGCAPRRIAWGGSKATTTTMAASRTRAI